MSPPKSYSVIIVPSDHSRTRQLQVSQTLVVTALAVVGLVIVTMMIFAATYTSVLSEARRAQTLEIENQRLTEQVERVNELSRELESISGLRAQVFNMLGAEDEDEGAIAPQDRPIDAEAGDSILSDAERLQLLFAEESRKPFAPRIWPVEGRVRREFFSVAEGGGPAHPGITLDARAGEPVRAAGSGRVLRVEPNGDEGQTIEIDHGYGFRTVYEILARADVVPGQEVAQGQVIGAAGPLTSETGNPGSRIPGHALYFELRVDGSPVNPRSYLAPR